MPQLVAAGAVLWRCPDPVRPDIVEVAMVHRPRYQDWSWPKGKPVKGETLPATVVREVAEETGHTAVLGPKLGSTYYPVAAGMKMAHYWAARSSGGHFEFSDEVDALRWVPATEAADLLSYRHDRTLLARLDLATTVTGTVLLVRHAKAGKSEEWDGADDLRPLTAAGRRQAEALRALLPLFGVRRVHSAPPLRCRQTVEGLAADLGVPVIEEPLLTESGYPTDPPAALRRVSDIATGPGPAVVCSQGGVIPHLVTGLAGAAELDLPDQPPSRKGSFWGLFFGGALSSPTLRAADYYDDPLFSS